MFSTGFWLTVSPLLLLVVSGLFIMLVDAFAKEHAELAIVTSASLAVSGAISLAVLVHGWNPGSLQHLDFIRDYLAVDKTSLFFDVVICTGGALSTLLAGGYLKEHNMDRGEFYVLILFSAFWGDDSCESDQYDHPLCGSRNDVPGCIRHGCVSPYQRSRDRRSDQIFSPRFIRCRPSSFWLRTALCSNGVISISQG